MAQIDATVWLNLGCLPAAGGSCKVHLRKIYLRSDEMAIFLDGQEAWAVGLLPELSTQEAKAAMLYAYGFSLRTIAKDGRVSTHTVRTYLDRAKEKFEIHSLFELRDICLCRTLFRAMCLINNE
ncbi:hypothetical protein ALP27_200218 [Pseudomonas savastanoi pv. glycinea]|nr:hypothetical protein ALP95_200141 [Pseudomonas savastanoi pv. glycinea]RMU51735.1 hypothetical protein ALP27_200218 [Pseudomonas savastanoi pv. glycinea]RMW32291.1 hypothetical protein ALO96_200078 [Pseudomonas savastanoi pv. glycinea]